MLEKIARKLLLLVLAISFIQSCVPYRKTVPIDGDKNNPLVLDSIFPYQRDLYKLQNFDIVDIQIYSPNQEAAAFFNKTFSFSSSTGGGAGQLGGINGGDIFYLNGYSVDENGIISMPVLGDISAAGKTLHGLNKYLADTLSFYFEEDDYLYVTVKLAGIRYTVTGEVNAPGTTVKLQNQVNILEAISGAGDFKDLANREEVIIYRQYPDGTKAHKVNLL
ncbi:MAG: polysaccharide biosynthesis/export family protein, partial [Bacteroidetes bacterium]|nr:polysaccharide biosynthesis/export family protein [Bacteroidota bacterium]